MKNSINLCAWIVITAILGSFLTFTSGSILASQEFLWVYGTFVVGLIICVWALLSLPNIDYPPVSVIILVYLVTFFIPWEFPLAIITHDYLFKETDTMNFSYMPFGWTGKMSMLASCISVWALWGTVESFRKK
jgi:hypothetical protein